MTRGFGRSFRCSALICENSRFRVSANQIGGEGVAKAATEETFDFIYKPVSRRFWINSFNPSPLMESCLTSPTAMASEMETKPDSERATVALITGSITPFSVRLAMASATPPILASTIP